MAVEPSEGNGNSVEKPPNSGKADARPRVIDRSKALAEAPAIRAAKLASQHNPLARSLGNLPANQVGQTMSHRFSALAKARELVAPSAMDRLANASAAAQRFAEFNRLPELIGSALRPPLAVTEFQRIAKERQRDIDALMPPPSYVSELQRMADEQRRQMAELVRPHEMFVGPGSVLAETMKIFKASGLFAANELYRTHFESVGSIAREFDQIGAHIRSLQSTTQEYLEYFKSLPERLRKNLVALAEAGWFLDSGTTTREALDFYEGLLEGTPEDVDRELAEYYRRELDDIETHLLKQHPTRQQPLREAFAAHRLGSLYSLSVQGFLTQAEGICFDRTKRPLFNKSGPRTLAHEVDPDSLERTYLDLLGSALPLNADTRRKEKPLPKLNRHAIMHGESIDYGDEINSLKAMSFLNFVSHAFDIGWEDQEIESEAMSTDG